jgi:hypothetical protein
MLRWVAVLCLLGSACVARAERQEGHAPALLDSDGDGLSDALEQSLLVQFAPVFMIGRKDCSDVPSEFQPGSVAPVVKAENGTIYGEVFPAGRTSPAKASSGEGRGVEIHFYHLWKQDCGGHGHPLDAEHVSVLVRGSGGVASDGGSGGVAATWTALYWYAAAHENTVCDVSQIARASTLGAEDRGAKVWVSPGKHASYLNETLCQRGCGADRCVEMKALKPGRLINLGEPGHPMHGAEFIASGLWPLAAKMETTNFPADAVARLNRLPETDIAWFHAGRHPVQGIIAISSSTEGALAESGRNTTAAISGAGDSTDAVISVAGDSTGDALSKSYRKTIHALGTSARHVGRALQMPEKDGGADAR